MTRKRAKSEETNHVGRPTDYDPKFCQFVINQMKMGWTRAMLCVQLGVCEQTFSTWLVVHPAFKKAYAVGKMCARAYLDGVELKNLDNPNFNTKLHELHCRNRFKYESDRLRAALNATEELRAITADISEGLCDADQGLKIAEITNIKINALELPAMQAKLDELAQVLGK